MIQFLIKGLIRDKSRSFFPVLIVALGVALTVFLQSWMGGIKSSLIRSTAHYTTGHVSVMTRAYAKNSDQMPNDDALMGIDTVVRSLRSRYPDLYWTPRIMFGGLVDVPDANGETREQAAVSGIGIDLFSPASPEHHILDVESAVVEGRRPDKPGEMLISAELAQKLGIRPGQTVTLLGSTMNGSMATANFTIAGTLRFGIAALDRATVIADISDVQQALDMRNSAGAIIGVFKDDVYREEQSNTIAAQFNAAYAHDPDKYAPVMNTLRTQSGLSDLLDYVGFISNLIIAIFVFAMCVVLWNAGLTGSLRRYGEFGLRLALGEDKGHIYRSMILESISVGIAGSLVGTAAGVAVAFYLQVHGIDIGSMMKNNSMMIANVVRAQVTPATYLVGFLPGVFATLLGSAISGLGIYKRQTSQLFKELEI